MFWKLGLTRIRYMCALDWWLSKSKNWCWPLIGGSKKSQKWFWPFIGVLKKSKNLLTCLVCCQFFHENQQFFYIKENWNQKGLWCWKYWRTRTRGSVILKFFKNPELKVLSFLIVKEPRIEGSFILTVKELKTERYLISNSLTTQNTILHKIKKTA
jgi:hypothetical protein